MIMIVLMGEKLEYEDVAALEPALKPVDDSGVNEIRVIVQGDQTMSVGPLILVTSTVIVEFTVSTLMICPTIKSVASPVHVIRTIFLGAKLPTLFTFHINTPRDEVLLLVATTPVKSAGEEEVKEMACTDDDDGFDAAAADDDGFDAALDDDDGFDAGIDDDVSGAVVLPVPVELEETRLLSDTRVIAHGVQRIPVSP